MADIINYETFMQVEMRVGRVVSATLPEWSRKLVELKVDFGPEFGERTILSGVREWYQPTDLEQKMFIFVVNLAERKMGDGVSQGMMLMADSAKQPIAIPVPGEAMPGDLIR